MRAMPVRYPGSSAYLTQPLTPLSSGWSDAVCSYDNAMVCGKISAYRRLPERRCKQDRKRRGVNRHDLRSVWGRLELANKLATFYTFCVEYPTRSFPSLQETRLRIAPHPLVLFQHRSHSEHDTSARGGRLNRNRLSSYRNALPRRKAKSLIP